MQNISTTYIAIKDDNGNTIVNPDELVKVLKQILREIRELENKLQTAESNIRRLK